VQAVEQPATHSTALTKTTWRKGKFIPSKYDNLATGWLRGTVARTSFLAGELSLSHARPSADG